MPRFKQIPDILKIMSKKDHIRNISIIAHIDHGKTTMTDHLLSKCGLLSPTIAGQARALDYLEEEQKRGITIKTANISLYHELNGEGYVINLIDTPGHVDFTQKVSRALRAADGAVVVVDAVEEVMVQTETVTRQALLEGVRPILYINKVDRLIKELKLSDAEVQEKFLRIIRDFNKLIDLYGDPEIKDKWKVNPMNETVIFGSALHGWGFTLKDVQEKGIKFKEIADYYETNEWEQLKEFLPLHDAILRAVIKNLPNPIEAQRYRIRKIWRGDLDSEIGQAMLNCDENGPTVICVNKVIVDPHAGIVCTGRIFSGRISKGDEVYLLNAARQERVQQVAMYMGPFREPVGTIPAGNIAAMLGLSHARAGETLVDVEYKDYMIPFEAIRYVSEPVMTIAIEPKRPADLPKLVDILNKLAINDPNLVPTINQETGEYLLSGMGELHLEIACKDIRAMGVDIVVSEPLVVYRETVTKKAGPFMGKSPNKHNKLWFTIEPLDERTLELLDSGRIHVRMSPKRIADILKKEAGWPPSEAKRVWAVDEHKNIIVNMSHGVQYLNEVRDSIISGFRWTCEAGPLTQEPIRGVRINLVDAILHEDPVHRGPAQIMPATKQAIFACFLSAKPVLLEPIYKIQVRVPVEYMGEVTSLIAQKRGRVIDVEQKEAAITITGYIPVAETIGLASIMRSATSGHAFWQCTFDHWGKVPESLLNDLIVKIRKRKGLPPEPPKAEDFIVKE